MTIFPSRSIEAQTRNSHLCLLRSPRVTSSNKEHATCKRTVIVPGGSGKEMLLGPTLRSLLLMVPEVVGENYLTMIIGLSTHIYLYGTSPLFHSHTQVICHQYQSEKAFSFPRATGNNQCLVCAFHFTKQLHTLSPICLILFAPLRLSS
jgi:hypothetical protein